MNSGYKRKMHELFTRARYNNDWNETMGYAPSHIMYAKLISFNTPERVGDHVRLEVLDEYDRETRVL